MCKVVDGNTHGGSNLKIPLQYQRTEYDCGPTAFLNAVSYLFPRNEIPPDILRGVMMYTLDSYNNKGEAYKDGTSQIAMSFLSGWLNRYAKAVKFPAACVFLEKEQVEIGGNGKIIDAIRTGGAAVLRLYYGGAHYVTLTGVSGNAIEMFDPYFRKKPFVKNGIKLIENKPYSYNRLVDFSYLDRTDKGIYSLGEVESRAAVLMFNSNT